MEHDVSHCSKQKFVLIRLQITGRAVDETGAPVGSIR
jgi:hypothetical protein